MTIKEQIETTLKRAGCTIIPLPNDDLPDFLVGANGTWYVLECRSPGKATELTPEQEQFHKQCRGSICTVTSVEGALRTVGMLRGNGNWATMR